MHWRDVISGRSRGLGPSFVRAALQAASYPYRVIVKCRNWLYDRGWKKSLSVSIPVVSVGNLTVGGTGKTPTVAMLARWIRARGFRVAIVSRGYGAGADGRNDEARELETKLDDVPHLQDPDRYAAATVACEELEMQVIVLDDGFQHRRLARNLDIVLLDASDPFGYEIASRRPVGEIQVSYRSIEDPTLLSGIRDYQIGDSLNRVHWRATARIGKLQSKVFQPTTVAGAMIVLDMHRKSNPDQHEPIRTDMAITAAASIAHTLYQMQQQFGLVTNGRDAIDRIRREGWATDYRSRDAAQSSVRAESEDSRLRPIVHPAGRGPEHFRHLHRTLARLERTDGLELSNLLMETQSRLPRDASVIAIVQQVDEMSALALGMLAKQGYAVSAIVNHFEKETVHEAASRLIGQRIPVYHLHDEDSIPQLCQRMLLKY